MLIELYIFTIVIIAYGTFTTLATIGFGKLRRANELLLDKPSTEFISVVISARNEEEHIEACLYQIIRQNYAPENFELIVIDDCSTDNTYRLADAMLKASALNYRLIKQPEHRGKKHNLNTAIESAKGRIIVTTDADVNYRNPNWLLSISCYFGKYEPDMLIMPIDFETREGFLPTFQILENFALTAITAGYAGIQQPFMCNGANLAFKKQAYHAVNGYQSHLHISSGEDVFLLEDLKKLPGSSIHYFLSRELIIKTQVQTRLSDFFSQRIRWAYKARYNSNLLNIVSGIIILLANLLFLALTVAILKKSVLVPYLSIFVVAKVVFDFLLLFLAADFLGRIKYIRWLIPFECVYWVYALFIGIGSLFVKPYWKGKKIN
jgi:glycosyltransferase involved in cell wall biosynthesis